MRQRKAIPLLDAPSFRAGAGRTLILRAVLAAGLVAALVAAYLLAHRPRHELGLVPGGTSPVVALDLSWSVSSGSNAQIATALRGIADTQRRVGLVLFSDTAYEALPPGTRSAELRPFIRFFERRKATPNPWTEAFSGGTRIWAALDLARKMLDRNRIRHGSVVLISDLADAPNDRAELAQAMVSYVREGIPLRIVALNPAPDDERLFRVALAARGSIVHVRVAAPNRPTPSRAAFPLGLAVAAGILALLLGANEHALGALAWRRREKR